MISSVKKHFDVSNIRILLEIWATKLKYQLFLGGIIKWEGKNATRLHF